MKEHRTFLCIVSLFLLLRVPLLFTSQAHLDADEAVVALMAKHIAEKGVHPVFFSGLPYNGGASVEAHLSSLISIPFGLTRTTAKSSALLLSLGLLVATYMFCRRWLGKTQADIASLLLITAEPLIVWNLKIRGGYLETMIFSVLIPWTAFAIFSTERRKSLYISLLGFLCGCALWCQEMSISIIGTAFLFWFATDRRFIIRRSFILFPLFFVLGNSPSIWFNLNNEFLNWKHWFLFLPQPAPLQQGSSLTNLFFNAAGFFHVAQAGYEGWAVDPAAHNLFSWLILGMTLAGIPAGLYLARKDPWSWRLSLYCLVFFSLHFFMVHITSHRTSHIYRFYLPLYPMLLVFLSQLLRSLSRRRWGMFISIAAIVLFAGHGTFINIEYIGEKAEWTHPDFRIEGSLMRLIPVVTSGESIIEAVNVLRSQGVKSVITSVYIKYRLIFESKEEILASSEFIPPTDDPYLYYDRLVQSDRTGPFAFVFFNVSPYNSALLHMFKEKKISWKEKSINELTIYYPFSRRQVENIFQGTPAGTFFK